LTLFGWDASDYDWDRGPMDLNAAARDGIIVFSFKATEGLSVQHVHLAESLNRARAAGIEFLGAYHVLRTASVSGQVDYLLSYVDSAVPWWRDVPGWFWQCDAEDWGYDFPGPNLVKAFCNELGGRTGRTVICYAPRGMYGDTLQGLGHPLWNANYGRDPSGTYQSLYPGDDGVGWLPYSGQTPVFWQYSDRATIGSQPGCDANAFRGSLDELRKLIDPNHSAITNGDDMPSGELGPGFAFDAGDNWIDPNHAVPVPLPTVGNGSGQWGDAWLYLAATTDLTLRFGAHASGVWTWQDVSLSLAGGTRGPLSLPQGTDTVLIGRKKRSPDDAADSGPVRWQVQYAPKG
jgi:GH25 family lysozyme M1 (1,4-beta-N-acetylmuramidase)